MAVYVPEYGNIHSILDAAKVADSLLCLLSPDGGIDDLGDYCLTCLFGQGVPSVTFGIQVSFIPHHLKWQCIMCYTQKILAVEYLSVCPSPDNFQMITSEDILKDLLITL